MAFDGESEAFDPQSDHDEPDLDISRTAHRGHDHAAERDCEEEYQKAVEALMERTCRLAREVDGGESAPAKGYDSRPVELAAEADSAEAEADVDTELGVETAADWQDDSAQTPSSAKPAELTPRAASKEDLANLEVMRAVANSSARRAVGYHAFQRFYASACQNLWLAAAALAASLLCQMLDAGPAAVGFVLVMWVAGAFWAYQSFRLTRQLANGCTGDFDAKQS